MARARKPISVEDLWQFERIGALSLAPDGAQAVCTLQSFSMEQNKGRSSLWLLSTFGGGPRRLTHCGEKDGQPAWSPSGERIAFVAWVWPELRGSRAQAKRWKEFKERKESAYVTSEAQYRYWDHHVPMGRVAHLHLLDVASGRITDLFEGTAFELSRAEPDANCFDVSPDGRRIVFAHDPATEKRFDNCRALAEIELRTRRVTTLAQDRGWDMEAPRYAPDGRRVAFLAAHQGRRHTMPAQLALAERDGGWKVASAAWDHALHAPLRWDDDGQGVCFAAEHEARNHLWRFDLRSRGATRIFPGGWVQCFDVASGVVAVAADAMDHPTRVHALREGEPPRRLERFNDELLATLKLGTHEDVRFTGAQGDAVQMWLVYPPGFDARRKYPLLHSIHGGPHAASGDTFHYRWNNHVFAAQGYVVACVNYHGSSGFGYSFLDSITHRWGQLELQDIEAATAALLKRPWVDKRRVFAAGGSYGGYLVAWMNAHAKPGRYGAYVCHAGCFDWVSMFAEDAYTWFPRELGASYWDDMARVHAQSPHAFAGAMKTPTLVVHGALDYRVPDGQGLAYYNTLKARGVDARLVWFPDENHWVLKPRNSKLWYGEFFAWLKRHDRAAKR